MALIEAAHRHLAGLPQEATAVVEFVRKRLEEMDLAPLGARSVEQQADLVCELAHQLLREVSRTQELEDALQLLNAPSGPDEITASAVISALRAGYASIAAVTAAVAMWEAAR